MGFKSPYREVGISAMARPKVQRDPGPRTALFAGTTDPKLVRLKHRWMMSSKKGDPMRMVCTRCRAPKFTVYGKPCRARK